MNTDKNTYRLAAGLALAASFMLVWLSLGVGIIGADGDPANAMYVGVLVVGVIGALIARFRPRGMARALFAMALTQALVAVIALVARLGHPYSPPLELVTLNGFFVALFVASAWLFRRVGYGKPQRGAAGIVGLDHVQLAMPSEQEDVARAFYVEVLGLREETKPATLAGRGGVWFAGGSARIHLGVEEDFRPARKAHPALLVNGLPALATRCREAGYDPVADSALPGYDRFYVTDPFGNRLELLESVTAANT